MKQKPTYYLWRDASNVFYITDYKETDKEGKVNIDGYGYLKVELVLKSEFKHDLLNHAQKTTK